MPIEVEGLMIPLRHDGITYYLKIREATLHDWETCQVVKFTSPLSWSKYSRYRRTKTITKLYKNIIHEWSKCLGHLNYEATKYTLKATIPNLSHQLKLKLDWHHEYIWNDFSTDTFLSDIKSYRGSTCGQVFLCINSWYTVFIPLNNKAYACTALSDYIKDPFFWLCQRRQPRGTDINM